MEGEHVTPSATWAPLEEEIQNEFITTFKKQQKERSNRRWASFKASIASSVETVLVFSYWMVLRAHYWFYFFLSGIQFFPLWMENMFYTQSAMNSITLVLNPAIAIQLSALGPAYRFFTFAYVIYSVFIFRNGFRSLYRGYRKAKAIFFSGDIDETFFKRFKRATRSIFWDMLVHDFDWKSFVCIIGTLITVAVSTVQIMTTVRRLYIKNRGDPKDEAAYRKHIEDHTQDEGSLGEKIKMVFKNIKESSRSPIVTIANALIAVVFVAKGNWKAGNDLKNLVSSLVIVIGAFIKGLYEHFYDEKPAETAKEEIVAKMDEYLPLPETEAIDKITLALSKKVDSAQDSGRFSEHSIMEPTCSIKDGKFIFYYPRTGNKGHWIASSFKWGNGRFNDQRLKDLTRCTVNVATQEDVFVLLTERMYNAQWAIKGCIAQGTGKNRAYHCDTCGLSYSNDSTFITPKKGVSIHLGCYFPCNDVGQLIVTPDQKMAIRNTFDVKNDIIFADSMEDDSNESAKHFLNILDATSSVSLFLLLAYEVGCRMWSFIRRRRAVFFSAGTQIIMTSIALVVVIVGAYCAYLYRTRKITDEAKNKGNKKQDTGDQQQQQQAVLVDGSKTRDQKQNQKQVQGRQLSKQEQMMQRFQDDDIQDEPEYDNYDADIGSAYEDDYDRKANRRSEKNSENRAGRVSQREMQSRAHSRYSPDDEAANVENIKVLLRNDPELKDEGKYVMLDPTVSAGESTIYLTNKKKDVVHPPDHKAINGQLSNRIKKLTMLIREMKAVPLQIDVSGIPTPWEKRKVILAGLRKQVFEIRKNNLKGVQPDTKYKQTGKTKKVVGKDESNISGSLPVCLNDLTTGYVLVDHEQHITCFRVFNVLLTTAHGPYRDQPVGTEVEVMWLKGGITQHAKCKILAIHPTKDVRVISAPPLAGPALEIKEIKFDTTDGHEFEGKVHGTDIDDDFVSVHVSSGHISIQKNENYGKYHGTTFSGWSGAPVRVNKNQVVGIHKSGAQSTNGANNFVPLTSDLVSWIRESSGNVKPPQQQ